MAIPNAPAFCSLGIPVLRTNIGGVFRAQPQKWGFFSPPPPKTNPQFISFALTIRNSILIKLLRNHHSSLPSIHNMVIKLMVRIIPKPKLAVSGGCVSRMKARQLSVSAATCMITTERTEPKPILSRRW
jgi:hypothetical protein